MWPNIFLYSLVNGQPPYTPAILTTKVAEASAAHGGQTYRYAIQHRYSEFLSSGFRSILKVVLWYGRTIP